MKKLGENVNINNDNNITNNSLMEDMKNITSNSSNIYKIININGN